MVHIGREAWSNTGSSFFTTNYENCMWIETIISLCLYFHCFLFVLNNFFFFLKSKKNHWCALWTKFYSIAKCEDKLARDRLRGGDSEKRPGTPMSGASAGLTWATNWSCRHTGGKVHSCIWKLSFTYKYLEWPFIRKFPLFDLDVLVDAYSSFESLVEKWNI